MVKKNVWHKIYFVILAMLLGLGQIQRIAITSEISFYLHDVWIVGWVGLNLIFNWRKIKNAAVNLWKKIKKRKVVVVVLAILLIVFVLGWSGAINRGTWEWRSLFYLLRIMTYLSFGWLVLILEPLEKDWYSKLFLLMNGVWLLLG